MSERLLVLLSGVVVGFLERSSPSDDPVLEYLPEHISSAAIPLSVHLPTQIARHPAQKVRPYLAGLLPENTAARNAWSTRLGVRPNDAFGLLAQMGWDCPGAVQFCREADLDLVLTRTPQWRPVDDAAIAERLRNLGRSEPSWTLQDEHWSLGGQQEKFALTRLNSGWHVAHGSAPTTHIVKPGIQHLHHQALVEHLTMAAAGTLGITTTRSTFTRFEEQWAIVIERFDRVEDGTSIRRLHQEDFAQACGRMPDRKYESDGGPGLADLDRILARSSTALADDRRAVADFAIINLVAGAPDGHAKNISLIHGPEVTTVAPLYDLATGLSYDSRSVERTVAMSIGGERQVTRIRRKQWEKVARLLQMDAEPLLRRVSSVAQNFPAAFAAALSDLPERTPGAAEVSERTLPALESHAAEVLDRL